MRSATIGDDVVEGTVDVEHDELRNDRGELEILPPPSLEPCDGGLGLARVEPVGGRVEHDRQVGLRDTRARASSHGSAAPGYAQRARLRRPRGSSRRRSADRRPRCVRAASTPSRRAAGATPPSSRRPTSPCSLRGAATGWRARRLVGVRGPGRAGCWPPGRRAPAARPFRREQQASGREHQRAGLEVHAHVDRLHGCRKGGLTQACADGALAGAVGSDEGNSEPRPSHWTSPFANVRMSEYCGQERNRSASAKS